MLIDGGAEKRPSESISFRSGMVPALEKACQASAPGCGAVWGGRGGKCANAKENRGHALRTIHGKRTRTVVSRRLTSCGRAHTDPRATEGTKEGTTISQVLESSLLAMRIGGTDATGASCAHRTGQCRESRGVCRHLVPTGRPLSNVLLCWGGATLAFTTVSARLLIFSAEVLSGTRNSST